MFPSTSDLGNKAGGSANLAMNSGMSILDRTLFSGICSLLYIKRQIKRKYNLMSAYRGSG